MKKTAWKKIGIITAATVLSVYGLFLISPIIVNPLIKNYTSLINSEINKATGLNSNLDGIKFVTTPKLTAGLKINKFNLSMPNNDSILSTENLQIKMSLLPLLARKIELDALQLSKADLKLKFEKDGTLSLMKYLPVQENSTAAESQNSQSVEMPFGIRLSDKLPDIKLKKYSVILTDGKNDYVLSSNKTEITNFIFNKKVKIISDGSFSLQGKEQFNYNFKILNYIMPNQSLHELVFNPQPSEEGGQSTEMPTFDIISALELVYKSNITANANADLVISDENMKGYADFTGLSLLNLPQSNINLKFNKNKTSIVSNIYTAKDEVSNINGEIKGGKNPNLDISVKSKTQISNILKIVKDLAMVFNINDLQTMTAKGTIDADFNVKSNFKTVKSNGYLKLSDGNIYYGLYKVGIENIISDILLDNNNINIKNIGFSVFNQPLKLYGTIKEDTTCDLHLNAERLSIKGLLVALGQATLMKENNVNSGEITANVDITGKFDKINPILKLIISNVDIKNIPADLTLKAPQTSINIAAEGNGFKGTAQSENIRVINPAVGITVPKVNANINDSLIELTQTPVQIDKINTAVSGKIENYLTEKIGVNFVTSGDIKSKLSGDINAAKQTLNLAWNTTSPSSIIIPMFDKSKMDFSGNITITGDMINPILAGNIDIPNLAIPEIPVTMSNLAVKLNGPLAVGNGSVTKFTSGGIEAENLTADFLLKGENFYLKNLKGDAFDGKIEGDIIYNLNNAKTSVNFKGNSLNATKAVYGATGIKNALSGNLSFDTALTMIVADYDDMMKSLRGNLNFSIKNGSFLTIGRFENFLKADNIITNGILKTTVNTILNSIGFADTAKYDYLDGSMSFKNGWADLKSIKSAGPAIAYYVNGKYNLLNATTNVVILGRLDSHIVNKLGPIGELSGQKLLSYIPKFGNMTANIANALSTNPKNENVSEIPNLTGNNSGYKDFKVVFNGGLDSTSSVKSFKWLQVVDLSSLNEVQSPQTVKETVKTLKNAVNQDLGNTVKSVTDTLTTQKEQWNNTKDQFKSTTKELKSLLKSF